MRHSHIIKRNTKRGCTFRKTIFFLSLSFFWFISSLMNIYLDIPDCCIAWYYCRVPVHCNFSPRLPVVDLYMSSFASAPQPHKSLNTRRTVPNPSNHCLLYKQGKNIQIGVSRSVLYYILSFWLCVLGNHVIWPRSNQNDNKRNPMSPLNNSYVYNSNK